MFNKKKLFLLTTLIILLIGVVSASEVSEDTFDNSEKVFDNIEDTLHYENNVVNNKDNSKDMLENDNINVFNKTDKNQRSIVKDYIKDTKEDSNNVYVSNYNELVSQIDLINKGTEKSYTINLNPGNYNATTNIVLESDTSFTKEITINANNIVLDGKNKYQFLIINTGVISDEDSWEEYDDNINLKINNIILKNFNGTFGGAIHKLNLGMLKINNSKFINNSAVDGGAIYNSGNLTITNTEFISNIADTPDEYGTGFGSGAISNPSEGTLTISSSKFINNSATRYGGAIGNHGSLTIFDTLFTNNKITSDYYDKDFAGGAIFNYYAGDKTVSIVKSKFSNNYAMEGSAIYNIQSNMSIYDSDFINNTIFNEGYSGVETFMYINNSKFINNTNVNEGYVIHNTANLTINNSKIMNNKGRLEPVNNYGNDGYYQAKLIIDSSEFLNNINNHTSGGAIYNRYGDLTIKNSLFINNTAADDGGAIKNLDAILTIENTTFTDNTAERGGAIGNDDKLTIISSKFMNNKAIEGGYYNYGSGGAIYNSGDLVITNTEFTNNSAIIKGGAIYNHGEEDNYYCNLTITNSKLINNTANSGEAIYNNGILTLQNSFLKNNRINDKGTNNIINTTIDGELINDLKENATITVGSTRNVYKGDQVSIYGKLSANGIDIPNEKVLLRVSGEVYTLTTTTYGNYNLKLTPKSYGNYTIFVIFAGTDEYASSSASTTFEVMKRPTLLTLGCTEEVNVGDKVCIYGKLTTDGKDMADRTIMLQVNDDDYYVQTTQYGNYKLYITATESGTNYISASFDDDYECIYDYARAYTTFEVMKRPTLLTLGCTGEVYVGDKVCIYGKLTTDGKDMADRTIELTVNDYDYYYIQTTQYGNYKLYITATEEGTNNITAYFYDDIEYLYGSSIADTTFVAKQKPTLITLGSTQEAYIGDNVCIYGKLTTNGKDMANKTIIIKVNNDYYHVQTTQYGNYKIYITATEEGINNITARYLGSNIYMGDINQTTFTAKQKPTLLTLGSTQEAYIGGNVCIYGKLTTNGKDMANKKIIIKVNNDYYNTQTTQYGNYKIYVTATIAGQNNITARYLGSNIYMGDINQTTFTVNKKDTVLTLGSTKNVILGNNICIFGKLTVDGVDIPYKKVNVNVYDNDYSVTTTQYGNYKLYVNATKLGIINILSSFDGDNNYSSSINETSLTVCDVIYTIELPINLEEYYKTVGNDEFCTWYQTEDKQQLKGVYLDHYNKENPIEARPEYLVIDTKFYFKDNSGNIITVQGDDNYGGILSHDLISGYTPYKVLAKYRKLTQDEINLSSDYAYDPKTGEWYQIKQD